MPAMCPHGDVGNEMLVVLKCGSLYVPHLCRVLSSLFHCSTGCTSARLNRREEWPAKAVASAAWAWAGRFTSDGLVFCSSRKRGQRSSEAAAAIPEGPKGSGVAGDGRACAVGSIIRCWCVFPSPARCDSFPSVAPTLPHAHHTCVLTDRNNLRNLEDSIADACRVLPSDHRFVVFSCQFRAEADAFSS